MKPVSLLRIAKIGYHCRHSFLGGTPLLDLTNGADLDTLLHEALSAGYELVTIRDEGTDEQPVTVWYLQAVVRASGAPTHDLFRDPA